MIKTISNLLQCQLSEAALTKANKPETSLCVDGNLHTHAKILVVS